ncbi:hypothetical protein EVAR_83092_1 [Eumeta japonica]|uniref:Uncharacterized protein n=1 Tax=Eumeta variegata TaxID=151549 RepID=A0A4C1WNY8_EUMVA|nr:hypothetical protein EVAR_83092_1 [Eumeta japonica]
MWEAMDSESAVAEMIGVKFGMCGGRRGRRLRRIVYPYPNYLQKRPIVSGTTVAHVANTSIHLMGLRRYEGEIEALSNVSSNDPEPAGVCKRHRGRKGMTLPFSGPAQSVNCSCLKPKGSHVYRAVPSARLAGERVLIFLKKDLVLV